MEAVGLGDCEGLIHLDHGLVMSRGSRDMSQGCHQDHRAADSHEDVVGQAGSRRRGL